MLEFSLGGFGKPSVVEPAGLRFNLSHSQSLALIAVDDDADVGIDVELLRPMNDAEALAGSYFTPAERQALEALAPEARDRAFLTCWTRKEACLKATGLGLSVDTRSFEVGLSPETRELSIACGDDVGSADGIVAGWGARRPVRRGPGTGLRTDRVFERFTKRKRVVRMRTRP